MMSIKDVARIAGVSVATVSRVLNNRGAPIPISDETRARVLAVVDQIHYRPNYSAQRLRNKDIEHNIGVYVPWGWGIGGLGSFTARLVESVSRCIKNKAHYISMIFYDEGSIHEHYLQLQNVRAHRISGMLIAGANPSDVQFLDDAARQFRHPPFVVLHRHLRFGAFVTADNRGAAQALGRHCVEKGHRRIAFVSTPIEHNGLRDHVYSARYEGYRAALTQNGIEPDEKIIRFTTVVDEESIDSILSRLLALEPAPQALFASRHSIALLLMKGLRARQIRIPQEMAVVTFADDMEICRIVDPPLTSMVLPVEEMAQAAIGRLLEIVTDQDAEGVRPALQETIPCRFVSGGSC